MDAKDRNAKCQAKIGSRVLILNGYNIGNVGEVVNITELEDGRTLFKLSWPGVNPIHFCSGYGSIDARDARLFDDAAKADVLHGRLFAED